MSHSSLTSTLKALWVCINIKHKTAHTVFKWFLIVSAEDSLFELYVLLNRLLSLFLTGRDVKTGTSWHIHYVNYYDFWSQATSIDDSHLQFISVCFDFQREEIHLDIRYFADLIMFLLWWGRAMTWHSETSVSSAFGGTLINVVLLI